MKRVLKNNFHTLLITAILILCTGLIFISCGTDPQWKVQSFGSASLNANECTEECGAYVATQLFDMANSGLTVEAWVKNTSSGNLNGAILSRAKSENVNGNQVGGGVQLYVKNNRPKFKSIINLGTGATSTFTVQGTMDALSVANGWTHIAGVLTSEDQSGSAASGCAVSGAQIPHLAIYENADLSGCSSTLSNFVPNDAFSTEVGVADFKEIYIGYMGIDNDDIASPVSFVDDNDNGSYNQGTDIPSSQKFEGLIDEVRFWHTARTQTQLQNCKDKKLELNAGECGRDNAELGGYWGFDEGSGSLANDLSGGGGSASMFEPHGTDNDDGWSSDVPF